MTATRELPGARGEGATFQACGSVLVVEQLSVPVALYAVW